MRLDTKVVYIPCSQGDSCPDPLSCLPVLITKTYIYGEGADSAEIYANLIPSIQAAIEKLHAGD